MESYNEIYNELSTQIENLNNNREENNEIKASLNEYIEYLKPSIKIEGDVEKILFIGEFIFFICNDKCEVKYSKFLQTTKKNKIVIKDKNFKNLGEIELNSTDYCISEINEDKIYVIICIDNRLYKLVDNKLEIFYEMRINFIIPINNNVNKYVISNNNGIFIYEGSIFKITRENLEIKDKKISIKNYDFGVLINEKTIGFSKSNELMIYNLNEMKPILELQKGFSENCYAFLLVENISLKENEKNKEMILLFGYEEDREYGFNRVVIKNGSEQFLKTKKFKIYCFIQIESYKEKIIEAFSEEYNKEYNYFLVGGYDYNCHENAIKLYIFNKYYNNIEREKYIRIEKNYICRDLLKIKSINQINYKNLIFNCIEGIEGGALLIDIMNLETIETKVYENESLPYNLEKISENNTFDLEMIDMPMLKKISIEYIYLLKDNYFIIVQQDKFYVANFKDTSFFYSYDIQDSITCICQTKKNQVIICQNDGLYKLVFLDNDLNKDKVRLDRLNDFKYKLVLNIANKENNNDSHEYVISLDQKITRTNNLNLMENKEEVKNTSLPNQNNNNITKNGKSIKDMNETIEIKGTFIVSRDISSINENDIKTKISGNIYKIGKVIEINNNIFFILINNIENKGIFEIVDKNNIENKYKPNESNYLYTLSENCLIVFKANEDSKNHICICAAKNENKNGILAINITLPLNKTFEYFKEIKNLEISCISSFKNEKINKEKHFTNFCIGGINVNNKVEINLNKIIYLDDQHKNCLSFEFIKKIICGDAKIDSINFMYHPKKGKEWIIASEHGIYKMNISNKEEEKKEGVK